ncbi:MAG: M67 family metallopeptidase [Actinomycetota bacterium]
MKLSIPQDVYDQMIKHCQEGMPNEACGLVGGAGGGDAVASKIYLLNNAAASPVYYRPDDKGLLAAMNDIDTNELDLVAIFHSHVASHAFPSPTDVREAHYPGVVYLIISLAGLGPDARGFLINKKDWRDDAGEIESVELVVS